MSSRRQRLADEIGSANVGIVADAYWQGWLEARQAAHKALEGDPMPTVTTALRTWLTEDAPRLRFSWCAEEVVIAVHNDEIIAAPEENPT